MGRAGLAGLSILLIDDDRGMRTLVRRMLGQMKVGKIVEAASGREGLEQAESGVDLIDLVICDWNMPDMSGMAVFERFRAARPTTPFLMLTGRADLDSVVSAKKAGIPAYVVKPVSQQELMTKICFLAGISG